AAKSGASPPGSSLFNRAEMLGRTELAPAVHASVSTAPPIHAVGAFPRMKCRRCRTGGRGEALWQGVSRGSSTASNGFFRPREPSHDGHAPCSQQVSWALWVRNEGL